MKLEHDFTLEAHAMKIELQHRAFGFFLSCKATRRAATVPVDDAAFVFAVCEHEEKLY